MSLVRLNFHLEEIALNPKIFCAFISKNSAMRTILLKSSDDKTFEVKALIANHSNVVGKLLEAFDESSSSSDSITIPLPNVKGATLSMVIEWISMHEDEQMQEEELRNWEAEFVNVDLNFIYDLILAADYLEVNAMFHRFCQKVADLIAGRSPEEIRKTFNIENDHSPEEEAELRRQNAWKFESDATTSTTQ